MANVDTNSRPNDVSADSDVLGELMRHLLPTPAISPPKATPIQSDYELVVRRLLGIVQPVRPVVQERSRITDIEVLLQSMLLVASVVEDKVCPPADRREPTCPDLDESFQFLPPGWRADRVDDEFVLGPPPKGSTCHQAGNVD